MKKLHPSRGMIHDSCRYTRRKNKHSSQMGLVAKGFAKQPRVGYEETLPQ